MSFVFNPQIFHQGKYFSGCSFLDASLRSNPSFIWQSIRMAQLLLKSGCFMRIGSGDGVRIFEDPWLVVNGEIMRVETRAPTGWEVAVVSKLFEENRRVGCWRVTNLLSEQERRAVFDIIPSCRNVTDRWAWLFKKDGKYFAKSAYRVLRREAESGIREEDRRFWKSMWRLKCPAKAKVLVWRACRGFMPTGDRLLGRRVEVAGTCMECGGVMELVEHMLVHCQVVGA